MLRCCCPCLGRKAVERFEQAQDKTFNKAVKAADEDKGLLAADGFELDDDIDDHAGEEAAVETFPAAKDASAVSSDRIKALLQRQAALTSEIDNEFEDSADEDS